MRGTQVEDVTLPYRYSLKGKARASATHHAGVLAGQSEAGKTRNTKELRRASELGDGCVVN